MNIRSLHFVLDETRAAVKRFPLAAAFCAAALVTAWSLIGGPQPEPHLRLTLLLTFGFGAALFFTLALVNERFPLPAPARPAHLLLAGGLFLVFFFVRFAGAEGLDYGDRFRQWAFAVIMLASFAPYIRADEPLGLWQFNRRLVMRGALSAVFTGVLFGGASLALAAVEKLLGVKVDEKAYQYLWSFAGLLFWPLHFMAGTPARYEALAADTSYPRGLKLFTQYVLLPLAGVYFLILYAHLGRILATQQWPQGTVSWLTGSASALGLAAFLLLYPVSDDEENRWIRTFSRGFCLAALPLLLMLFTAAYKRVAQYGLTEHRYFLVCLGLWLFGIFLYFLLARRPDIRRVPMTLAVLAAVTSLGPWGAYSAGLASQSARLELLLAGNGLLVGGKAAKAEQALPADTRQQIGGALDYILRFHGAGPLKRLFPPELPALAAQGSGQGDNKPVRDLMAFLGQEYVDRRALDDSSSLSIRADNSGMDISGYDHAVRFYCSADRAPAPADDGGYRVELGSAEPELQVFKGSKFVIDLPLGPLVEAAAPAGLGSGRVAQALLKTEAGNRGIKVRVYLSRISVEREKPGAPEVRYAEGLLLVKVK